MKEEYTHHAIPIDSTEAQGLPLCQMNQSENKEQEEKKHYGGSDETLFLAYGTEDKVGILRGNVFELGLGAIEKALSL